MAAPSDNECTYVTVAVVRRDSVFLLVEPPARASKQMSTMLFWDGAVTGQDDFGFQASYLASLPGVELSIVGVEGEVECSRHTAEGGVDFSGHVDPTETGPSGRGWLRDARYIDGRLYAVGMSRQAYVRDPRDVWHHVEGAMLAELGAIAGLNCIGGFSDNEIYAAGLNGEIWRYDGSVWTQLVSPTNVQLNAMRRCGDFVYIVGSSGVVLRGRHDHFEVIATADDSDNLYAVTGFGADVYLASMRKLYKLQADYLEEVDTGLGEITAGALDANDGVLWSVGAHHLITTEDGQSWAQLFT
ncbi:MAG: hypothetical protein JWN04_69 [Myxococcaceae bacterium]|nr:hypothetical protein [Myxococcaceae bacterium]